MAVSLFCLEFHARTDHATPFAAATTVNRPVPSLLDSYSLDRSVAQQDQIVTGEHETFDGRYIWTMPSEIGLRRV